MWPCSVLLVINYFGIIPPQTLPDHSFLISTFSVTPPYNRCQPLVPNPANTALPKRKSKKNLNKIDSSFFMSEEISNQILNTINKLEMGIKNQNEIDRLWFEVKTLFLNEMSKLPDLPTSTNKKNNRNFRKCQPFWNNELENLWKDVCTTERFYTQYTVSDNNQLVWKKYLKSNFKNAQKLFDKKFRSLKR